MLMTLVLDAVLGRSRSSSGVEPHFDSASVYMLL